jgi:hypothetical protein
VGGADAASSDAGDGPPDAESSDGSPEGASSVHRDGATSHCPTAFGFVNPPTRFSVEEGPDDQPLAMEVRALRSAILDPRGFTERRRHRYLDTDGGSVHGFSGARFFPGHDGAA